MLMAKSRHKKPENVRRYFKPSPEAISELTSLLAPGRRAPLTLLSAVCPTVNHTTARRVPPL